MEGINAGRVDDATSLYADDATLIPTFSAHTLRTEAERAKYFQTLGARPKLTVFLHDATFHDQRVTDTVRIISGIYAFRFEMDGELLTFEARFTFVVDRSLAAPILHHHSSQIPRALG